MRALSYARRCCSSEALLLLPPPPLALLCNVYRQFDG